MNSLDLNFLGPYQAARGIVSVQISTVAQSPAGEDPASMRAMLKHLSAVRLYDGFTSW